MQNIIDMQEIGSIIELRVDRQGGDGLRKI